MIDGWEGHGGLCNPLAQGATARAKTKRRRNTPITRLSSISRITDRRLTHGRQCSVAGSIEDIFLSCSEPKRNVVEPSLVSVGKATMIQCRRRCCWWCVQDVRLQDCYAQVTPGLAECCESACWRVLCKCMLDIRCSVLRGWSCAITKSFEFWLRTVEKMGLILSMMHRPPSYEYDA